MRKINNIAGGKRARWQRQKKTGSTNNRQFHSTRKRQPSYGAMRAHLQEHSLCVLCSGPASFHFASDSESAADTAASTGNSSANASASAKLSIASRCCLVTTSREALRLY